MGVDEGRQHDLPVGVDLLGLARRLERVADGGDAPVAHQQVEAAVEPLGGVDEAGAADHEVGGGPGALRERAGHHTTPAGAVDVGSAGRSVAVGRVMRS